MPYISNSVVSFRLDCHEFIGSGHLYRCLSLANALVDKGMRCEFIVRDFSNKMISLAEQRGHEVIYLTRTEFEPKKATSKCDHQTWLGSSSSNDARQFLNSVSGKIVVVDHYGVDTNWLRKVSARGYYMVVIDDGCELDFYPADMILNPTYAFERQLYKRKIAPETDLVIGADAVFLGNDWLKCRDQYVVNRNVKNIAFCPGGTDPFNTTEQFLIPLAKNNPSYKFSVFFRANRERRKSLQELALGLSNIDFSFDSIALSGHLVVQDLVIGSAGSGSWERCCLGIPQILIRTTLDQYNIAKAFENLGAALVVDVKEQNILAKLSRYVEKLDSDIELRLNMNRISREMIDGQGSKKVAASICRMVK